MYRIVLIDDDDARVAILRDALIAEGHSVPAVLSWQTLSWQRVEECQAEVIIADASSPARDVLEHIVFLSETLELPVVVLGAPEDEDTMRRAIRAGVAAYVAHGIAARDIAPILKVAALRYAEYRQLRQELSNTRTALNERKIIEQAKGIVMRDLQITEAEAYQRMRRLAMNQGKKLIEIALQIIEIEDL
ncbi:ANTAR domain-containing protein [Acidithiobacillus sp. CV18-2]|uniref:ANTAR domain-containing protein n=1 Tax=Igneacidithiobacillus copahuensis TaxID=2724909 RepID=A0AAE2YM84_9PROT|nr:ANTAR domain-containing protein [Igneacidithiobacillus copahuensis]MBU2754895.1 ANTAR domain-containing protein [Acidithiobacillus sp. CV18-3]MBU2756557.1 ANTAR domain-containing protein [Acidithiobacillus sp. BN09-2]MBU2777191.1 ANTAR domain-containing protein [Acidithiobacillus sp. CV18-2]MBU2796088.1 ANTAR domain-containing protein [Acidithiobacillus sp. VAN18-2]MBU2799996.1 ANTAR domain-containing protein [Acidithiobacillus sp. VAN18-4]UTV80360.1 ANTAR domain-containing protein [Acidit